MYVCGRCHNNKSCFEKDKLVGGHGGGTDKKDVCDICGQFKLVIWCETPFSPSSSLNLGGDSKGEWRTLRAD